MTELEYLMNPVHSTNDSEVKGYTRVEINGVCFKNLSEMLQYMNKLRDEIKQLGERCLQLQKDKGNLIDENNELKAQIEKMKRCSICKFSSDLGYCKIRCNGGECNKMDKWELAND